MTPSEETPPKMQKKSKESEADTKRLARCGRCVSCKAQVRLTPPCDVCRLTRLLRAPETCAHCALRLIWARRPDLVCIQTSSRPPIPRTRAQSPCSPHDYAASCVWFQDCGNCYNCADKPKFGGPGARASPAPSAYATAHRLAPVGRAVRVAWAAATLACDASTPNSTCGQAA